MLNTVQTILSDHMVMWAFCLDAVSFVSLKKKRFVFIELLPFIHAFHY